MNGRLLHSLLLLPVPNLEKTSNFYMSVLSFRAIKYLESSEPHICLYRDNTEIILLQSKLGQIQPNRVLHGYGYDGYFTTEDLGLIYEEVRTKDVKIVKELILTDYGNQEFVIEDVDKRWIAIGLKQQG